MTKYSYDALIHAEDNLLSYWTKGGYSRNDDSREVYYIQVETWEGHDIYAEVDADDDRGFSKGKVSAVIAKFREVTLQSYQEYMTAHIPELQASYSEKARQRGLQWSWYTEVVTLTAPFILYHETPEQAVEQADRLWSEFSEKGEQLEKIRVTAGIRLYDENGKVPLYETIKTHMVRK